MRKSGHILHNGSGIILFVYYCFSRIFQVQIAMIRTEVTIKINVIDIAVKTEIAVVNVTVIKTESVDVVPEVEVVIEIVGVQDR